MANNKIILYFNLMIECVRQTLQTTSRSPATKFIILMFVIFYKWENLHVSLCSLYLLVLRVILRYQAVGSNVPDVHDEMCVFCKRINCIMCTETHRRQVQVTNR